MCQTELNALLPLLLETGVTFDLMSSYFGDQWKRTRAWQGGKLNEVFSESRARHFYSTGKLSMFASEMLGLVLPFTHMLESIGVVDDLPLELNSWRELARVVRCIQFGKQGRDVGDRFDDSLKSHGDAHLLAYGKKYIKPKFFVARLLPRQRKRDGRWVDCFPAERKHQLLKAAASPISNTRRYERSVLAIALNLQMESLLNWKADGLHCAVDAPQLAIEFGAASCMVSAAVVLSGTQHGRGDILVSDSMCVEVLCGLEISWGDGAGLQLALLVGKCVYEAEAT